MANHTHVAKPRIDMINLYPLKPTYTERKANYTNSTTPTYQYIQTYIYIERYQLYTNMRMPTGQLYKLN